MRKLILLVPSFQHMLIKIINQGTLSLGAGSAHIDPVGEPQLAFQADY